MYSAYVGARRSHFGEFQHMTYGDRQIQKVVGATGFEPATPCAQGRCATRLRYAPTPSIIACSAPERERMAVARRRRGSLVGKETACHRRVADAPSDPLLTASEMSASCLT